MGALTLCACVRACLCVCVPVLQGFPYVCPGSHHDCTVWSAGREERIKVPPCLAIVGFNFYIVGFNVSVASCPLAG